MSTSDALGPRSVRLAVVSSFALGVIWLLARDSDAGTSAISACLLAGWLAMPLLLGLSVWRPALRPAVLLPSTLVTLGLAALVAGSWQLGGSGPWLLLLAGILLGDLLGAWFWFRLLPVPASMLAPNAPTRLALIVLHVALVMGGIILLLMEHSGRS